MNKINSDTRPSFFKSKTTNIENIKGRQTPSLLNRNELEKQNEIKESTSKDVTVDIPDKIKDFSRIKYAVENSPDRDNTEKIQDLRGKISKGQYDIDFDELAKKIIESE